MPSTSVPAAVRGSDSVLRIAALVLPFVFVLWQATSSSHRVSAPTVKLSVKVAGYCFAAAMILAFSCSNSKEVTARQRGVNGAYSSHESTYYASSSVRAATVLHQLYRSKFRTNPGATLGVQLERTRLLEYSHQPNGLPDSLLDSAYDELCSQRSKATRFAPNNHGDDKMLLEALEEFEALTSATASASDSSRHTPLTQPATPDFIAMSPRSLEGSSSTPLLSTRRASDASSTAAAAAVSAAQQVADLGPVLKKWRHNPYTIRGFTVLEAGANFHTVPVVVGVDDRQHVHDVRLDVLLKPSNPPIDLRRRGKAPSAAAAAQSTTDAASAKATPKKDVAAAPATDQAPKSGNPLAAQARKNFKKDCEHSKMPIEVPLYAIDSKLSVPAVVPQSWKASLDEGWTTLTGLPNADGHRVAEVLLGHYAKANVIRAPYELSNDVRRLDRFNTGACHVLFADVEDAKRLQLQLRADMVFADFRAGSCVVGRATD